ncbi:MAG: insulinase family protein, partial [Bacteroidales bacterium]|nr:insulinase family protein [Bacteroidales bacterium]
MAGRLKKNWPLGDHRVRIQTIEITNYKAFFETHTFNVTGKKFFICGEKGSGKSSLGLTSPIITESNMKYVSSFKESYPLNTPEYLIDQLPNGIRLVTVPMPHQHAVELVCYLAVGGRCEPLTQSGISHFLEHMLF